VLDFSEHLIRRPDFFMIHPVLKAVYRVSGKKYRFFPETLYKNTLVYYVCLEPPLEFDFELITVDHQNHHLNQHNHHHHINHSFNLHASTPFK